MRSSPLVFSKTFCSRSAFFTTSAMMKHLCVLTLVALTFELGRSQELETLPYSWLPEKFPNPIRNPRQCGLGDEPGYVCDPNGLLTRHQRKTLNWFLKGIADTVNTDECPCSRYHCENYRGQRFYKVAVALVPSLAIPRNTDGRDVEVLDQANTFAYRLENDLWNMSVCEEDIVVLYSRDDRALVTMTGKTAGRKLNAVARNVIHSIVGEALADGRINEGLERMVHEIELVLNGKRKYFGNLAGQTGGSSGLQCLCSSSLLLLLLMAFVSPWLTHSLTASE